MSTPLRMLQIEDSEGDAALMVRHMERAGYQVEARRVEDADGLRRALAEAEWDVVVSDHQMAQFDAPAALRILQESGKDIPFLVVSGAIGEEFAVAMMKSGAHDYLLKDNLARLAPAVEREIREAQTRRERRQAGAELRESQERLAGLMQATQVGSFEFFPKTKQLIWSDLAKLHLGLPLDAEATSDTILSAVHPEDRERAAAKLDSAMQPASGGQYAVEFRTVGVEDHVERHVSCWGRAFFDADGKPVRFVGLTRDITDRRQLEEQFRQAQKLESIGRLAGGVAHDFNNLLTIITGYSEMAIEELGPQHPVRDALREIALAAAKAGDLTRQLLTFSRRQIADPKPVVLNDLVRAIENMLARLLGEEITLELSLDTDDSVVHAGAGQLEQVIMNLAVNARDAMPAGGKLLIETYPIVVDAEFAEAHLAINPGPYVVLAISDTGTGMTQEVKAHIFEPFFTTKEPGRGTGLGLSTVWGIVQQAGGSVSVYSEPGRGTSFRLLFPALRATQDTGGEPPAAALPSGQETVLLAEDEPAVRRYVVRILEKHGYTVLPTSNGREALQTAEGHSGHIDLLLTDIVMPEMGGAELCGQFTALRPEARILCMSGYSDRLWPEARTGHNYLQKPFTPAALLAQVRAVLDGN